jgi:hypothetical protein
MDASAMLRALDFTGAAAAELSFWTNYRIEYGWDFMYFEVSVNGLDWNEIAKYTGNQYSWVQKTYSLDDYIGESNVIIRFRFSSDSYSEDQGMYIDDLGVTVNGVGLGRERTFPVKASLTFIPNPAQTRAMLNYQTEGPGRIKILLADATGVTVKILIDGWKETGVYSQELDISSLPAGVYFGVLEQNGRKISRKLVISR